MEHAGRIWIALFAVFVVYSALVYRDYACTKGCTPTDAELRGLGLWQAHNCQACHQMYGLGGYMGPDLTDVTGRSDDQRLRTFIRYGTGRMPAHEFTDAQLDDLVAYLHWVDRSGDTRVPPEAVHWTGTFVIERRP
jgi:nitric oxide reductase subunit C